MIRSLLGHKDTKTTAKYAHLFADRSRQLRRDRRRARRPSRGFVEGEAVGGKESRLGFSIGGNSACALRLERQRTERSPARNHRHPLRICVLPNGIQKLAGHRARGLNAKPTITSNHKGTA